MTNNRASSLNPKPPHQYEEELNNWLGINVVNVCGQGCCCCRRQRRHLISRAGQHDDGGSTSRQTARKNQINNQGTKERRRRCLFKRTSIKQREGQDQHQEHYPKRRE